MFDNEDIEYEINAVFLYMVKNNIGNIKELIKETGVGNKAGIIIVNSFNKNGLIEKYREKEENMYKLNLTVSSVVFGKIINMGVNIEELEKNIKLSDAETLKDLTNFISNGSLDKIIEEEENKKREDFLKNIEDNCKSQIAQTSLGIHCENIEKVINKSKNEQVISKEAMNILEEIKEELKNEFNGVLNKLKNKKISNSLR